MFIFFREPDGAWKGPYTEKQVQQWYREQWFTNQFEFIISANAEKISLEAKGTTLSELKAHNGMGCVFLPLGSFDDTSSVLENKLKEMDHKLRNLKSQCTEMMSLEKRIAEIQIMFQKLDDEMQTEAEVLETTAEKYDKYANLIIEVLTAMEFDKFERLPEINKIMMTALNEITTMDQKDQFFSILLGKLKNIKFFMCRRCNLLMLTPRHAILHLVVEPPRPAAHAEVALTQRLRAAHAEVDSLNEFCKILRCLLHQQKKMHGWMTNESATRKMHTDRTPYSRELSLFPDNDIFALMMYKHLQRAYLEFQHILVSRMCRGVVDISCIDMNKIYPRIARIAPEFMRDFQALAGNKMTGCTLCKVVTVDFESYLNHVTSYVHILLYPGESFMDPVTIFVNYLRKNQE